MSSPQSSRSVYPINYYIRDATFDMPALDSLPALDSTRPKPGADLVPAIFQKRFSQWSSLTHDHFTFNAVLKAKLERALWELGLDKARSQPVVGCVSPCRVCRFVRRSTDTMRLQSALARWRQAAGRVQGLLADELVRLPFPLSLSSLTAAGLTSLFTDAAAMSLCTARTLTRPSTPWRTTTRHSTAPRRRHASSS
mgnify:CR=1 FL=1